VNEWAGLYDAFGKWLASKDGSGLYFSFLRGVCIVLKKRILEWRGPANADVEKRYIVWVLMPAGESRTRFYSMRESGMNRERGRVWMTVSRSDPHGDRQHRLIDVVRSEQRVAAWITTLTAATAIFWISAGKRLLPNILARAKERTSGWGIELIDAQVKLINLEPETEAKTMLRMSRAPTDCGKNFAPRVRENCSAYREKERDLKKSRARHTVRNRR
jgi:hypothetical protein